MENQDTQTSSSKKMNPSSGKSKERAAGNNGSDKVMGGGPGRGASSKRTLFSESFGAKPERFRFYEAVVLLHPDSTPAEQKELFTKNKGIIESFKGEVFSLETWGKRSLANPIGKNRKAYYFHVFFTATPEAIAELERTMRINDRVFRVVHTRLDERMTLAQHMEVFKKGLLESLNREKEREARIQIRKAQAAGHYQEGGGFRERGGRGGFGGGGFSSGGGSGGSPGGRGGSGPVGMSSVDSIESEAGIDGSGGDDSMDSSDASDPLDD